MKKIIFDVETTGLNACENQIAQLSYVVIGEDFDIEKAKNFYFTVDYMEPRASSVNGLTEKILEKLSNNKKFKDFAEEIYKDFLSVDVLIAHNLDFDLRFLVKEFKRLGFDIDKLGENKRYFCTMESYTMFMQIPHPYYGLKYPRLEEVIDYLSVKYVDIEDKAKEVFRCDAVSYHDSRFDVIATLEAYKQVKNMSKIITCNTIVHGYNSAKRLFERIESNYISKVNLDNSCFKDVESDYNILLGDDKKNLKRSFQRVVKKINYIIDAIEEEERTELER